MTLSTQHRHRADQQPQRPDGAAVGIDPAGGLHHLRFAFATEAADGFAQRDIRRAAPALLGQRVEGRLQAAGGAFHQRQREVLMRATAAAVDQTRFRAQTGFVNQAGAGGVRQPADKTFGVQGRENFHYQLRNFAGGLYSPSDHSTRSATLPAASSERVASLRRIPRSSG